MKTFTFIFDPEATVANIRKSMLKAIKTGIPHIEEDQIRSNSIKTILAIATENRISIFNTIRDEKPDSISELAKFMGKDVAYISKEIKTLEALELIKLKKETVNGRDRQRPTALYDRIVLDFGMGKKRASK